MIVRAVATRGDRVTRSKRCVSRQFVSRVADGEPDASVKDERSAARASREKNIARKDFSHVCVTSSSPRVFHRPSVSPVSCSFTKKTNKQFVEPSAPINFAT